MLVKLPLAVLFLVAVGIEFYLAAKNPIDYYGVTQYAWNADCGNDQHRAKSLMATACIFQRHAVSWVDRR